MPDDPKMALIIGAKSKDDGYGPLQGDKMKPDYLEVDPPKGMDMSGHKEGDMMDMVCSFEMKDSKLCLKKIDGMEVGGDGEKEPDEDEGNFTDAVMGGKENMPEEEAEGM